jgi:prepilin-type N-terminal cleavage/methylation domain-containing protein
MTKVKHTMTTGRPKQTAAVPGQAGFTLLELLLVVAILSSLALAATTFVDNQDSQARFEATRERLAYIREAVLGDPRWSLNSQPAIGGFAADVGRLPQTLDELIRQPTDCDPVIAGPQPCPWSFDAASGLWAGWHGPYIHAFAEQSNLCPGEQPYRDGWGNAGCADSNFGWSVALADDPEGIEPTDDALKDALTVKSKSSDGAVGGSGYAADYPASGYLVGRNDFQFNLKGWSVTVKFVNPATGTGTLPAGTKTLNLRLYYPEHGTIKSLDSEAVTLDANTVAAGASIDKVFSFGTTDTFVPWGVRSVDVVEGSGEYVEAKNSPQIVTLHPHIRTPVAIAWLLE